MVIPNPLDKVHVEPVHSLRVHTYNLKREGVHITEKVTGTYMAWWMRLLTRMESEHMPITFSSHGSSVSVADALWKRVRVVILFTAYQDEKNQCRTHTAIWLNSYNPLTWLRALIVILVILKQDVDILNNLSVTTNFTSADEGMIAFKSVVDSMPTYSPPV